VAVPNHPLAKRRAAQRRRPVQYISVKADACGFGRPFQFNLAFGSGGPPNVADGLGSPQGTRLKSQSPPPPFPSIASVK
jgi:hypothetical protein